LGPLWTWTSTLTVMVEATAFLLSSRSGGLASP
jgi:hypothetical protein